MGRGLTFFLTATFLPGTVLASERQQPCALDTVEPRETVHLDLGPLLPRWTDTAWEIRLLYVDGDTSARIKLDQWSINGDRLLVVANPVDRRDRDVTGVEWWGPSRAGKGALLGSIPGIAVALFGLLELREGDRAGIGGAVYGIPLALVGGAVGAMVGRGVVEHGTDAAKVVP